MDTGTMYDHCHYLIIILYIHLLFSWNVIHLEDMFLCLSKMNFIVKDPQFDVWRDETARSSIASGIASKIIPNLPILGN